MKTLNAIIVLLIFFSLACSSTETKETDSGLKYTIFQKGEGNPGDIGQIIVFNFEIKDPKDSVWLSSYLNGVPNMAGIRKVADSLDKRSGIQQLIQSLSKNDSAGFTSSLGTLSELMNYMVPPTFDTTQQMTFGVKVVDIIDMARGQEYSDSLMVAHFGKIDDKTIADHLAMKNIEASKLPSGIYYVAKNEGTGDKADSGQVVSVNYSGYLLDGTYFDSNVESVAKEHELYSPDREYVPFEVTIDQSAVIKGWHLALKELKSGGSGTFFIPSYLAYGPQARPPLIKPNSVLVFDIERVEPNN